MNHCFASSRRFPLQGIVLAAALAGSVLAATTLPAAAQVMVTTQHNDNSRTGANLLEHRLSPLNVTETTFGKLFTIQLDANVNGQVLYVPQVKINGTKHNVIYVYTSNNSNGSPCSLWAWDADTPSTTPLWQHVLPDSAQWTTCTPVIDPSTSILYVVTKTSPESGSTYLRAFDIITGNEEPGSPIQVAATVPGTGDGSSGGKVSFDSAQANCRPGLLLLGGTVYIAFAHNSDSFPYHGWVFGYDYSPTNGAFTQTAVFCTTPNLGLGGIWQAGKGLVADANGYIYCATGNGGFDANASSPATNDDYGMSIVKLSTPSLSVSSWFAPFDELNQSNQDLDMNNSGPLLIPETTRLFTGATKFGAGFLVDTGSLGGFTPGGPDNIVARLNSLTPNNSVGQDAVCWDTGSMKYVYLWANGANLEQFQYDPSVGNFSPAGIYKESSNLTQGAGLAITANAGKSGILWAADYGGAFRAFNASDVSQPMLWDSQTDASRDGLGSVGHFQFPTIANSKAYVPTGAATIAVYGLLPHLTAVANATVRAGSFANTNYGGAADLIANKATNDSSSPKNRCIYIKFDLSKLTVAPTNATLVVTQPEAAKIGPSSQGLQLYSIADTSWTQTGITWNNAPGLDTTNFTSTGTLVSTDNVAAAPGQTTYDVTSLVSANLGKMITLQLIDSSDQNVSLSFLSRSGGGVNAPSIVLSS